LYERIRQLFGLVRVSLAEELNGAGGPPANASGPTEENGRRADVADIRSTGPRNNSPPATQSQVKALYAITKARRLNLQQLLRDRFGTSRPDDLTLKQASQLIGELKRSEHEEGGRA
jgi:hypothetical protein